MRTGTGLTIRDYFNRVNSGSRDTAVRQKTQRGASFTRALEATGADAAAHGTRLTIQDYFKTPVRGASFFSSKPPLAGRSGIRQTGMHPLPAARSATPPVEPQVDPPEPEGEMAAIESGIQRAAARYDLSPALIRAVVKAESNYQTRAVSPAGALGLMQLMPATARELGVTDPFDIKQNIDGGAHYLRRMLDRFDGDLKLALSAYNAGPGTVARYDGDVPYAETRGYVARVLHYADRYSGQSV